MLLLLLTNIYSRRKPKKQQETEEISPDKLSKEAFRLLRTAQSLLRTREPDLAHVNAESSDDVDFLVQLAKEFPPLESRPQRTTSFSLSPKLLTPERDLRTSATFNRKLSLPLNCIESRRNSMKEPVKKCSDLTRGSIAESDTVVTIATDEGSFNKEHRNSNGSDKSTNENNNKYKCRRHKVESEKSNSPPIGSVSSAEDESGFSSMNSFQDIGLPTVNSTVCEEISSKEAMLRSMLHSTPISGDLSGGLSNGTADIVNNLYRPKEKYEKCNNIDEIKLWHKPASHVFHQRRNSSPAGPAKEKTAMKVLWV